jgi:anti-sigma factor RsiW
MTCREVEKLLDLFLDGELEARAMRTVALHVTRCTACEAALQHLERLQEVVVETFTDAVNEVDFSRFWPEIATRLAPIRESWWSHLQRVGPGVRSAIAVAVLIVALALGLAVAARRGATAAVVNNQVRIDSLTSAAPSVALLSEPGSNTTVIWVVDDGVEP